MLKTLLTAVTIAAPLAGWDPGPLWLLFPVLRFLAAPAFLPRPAHLLFWSRTAIFLVVSCFPLLRHVP